MPFEHRFLLYSFDELDFEIREEIIDRERKHRMNKLREDLKHNIPKALADELGSPLWLDFGLNTYSWPNYTMRISIAPHSLEVFLVALGMKPKYKRRLYHHEWLNCDFEREEVKIGPEFFRNVFSNRAASRVVSKLSRFMLHKFLNYDEIVRKELSDIDVLSAVQDLSYLKSGEPFLGFEEMYRTWYHSSGCRQNRSR